MPRRHHNRLALAGGRRRPPDQGDLAIRPKNTRRAVVTYLSDPETDALLAAPNRATWTGRRDHLIILTMVTTGLRVSELTGLTRADIRPTHPGRT